MPREDTDIFVSRESEVIKRVINGGSLTLTGLSV